MLLQLNPKIGMKSLLVYYSWYTIKFQTSIKARY
jgi:hypothetical protein